jgi:hypothetical protein
MTPDSQKTVLRSRPQAANFGATAGQGAVTREAAACRNRLLTRYPGLGIGYRRRNKLFEPKYSCEGYFLQIGLPGASAYISAQTRFVTRFQ